MWYMDSVTIEGKKYIKATKSAEAAGYTSDYVGQLCRSEKIDAVVIGKTWYVFDGALSEHKKNRSRSNTEVTKREVQERKGEIETASQHDTRIPAYRKHLMDTAIQYTALSDDLLPMVEGVSSPHNESKEREESQNETDTTHVVLPKKEDTDAIEIPIRKDLSPDPLRYRVPSPAILKAASRPFSVQSSEAPLVRQEIQPISSSSHAVTRRIPLVPMVIAITALFLFVLAQAAIHGTWSYSTDATQKASVLSTSYDLSTVEYIIETIREFKQ